MSKRTIINESGKVSRITNGIIYKNKGNHYLAAQKIIDREIAYYEKNWPFYRPSTTFGKLMSLFWNFRLVRRIIGGTWIKGEEFNLWLKTNNHFNKEWLKGEYEIW